MGAEEDFSKNEWRILWDAEVFGCAEIKFSGGWVYLGGGGVAYDVSTFVAFDINDIVGAIWTDNGVFFPVGSGVSEGNLGDALDLGSRNVRSYGGCVRC